MNTNLEQTQTQSPEDIIDVDITAIPTVGVAPHLTRTLIQAQEELEQQQAHLTVPDRALEKIQRRVEFALELSRRIVPTEQSSHDVQDNDDAERSALRDQEELQWWKKSRGFGRDVALLRLLAETGVPTWAEAQKLLRTRIAAKSPSGTFEHLEEMRLIELIEVPGRTSSTPVQHLVRLAERGTRVCRTSLHLEPVPSRLTELLARHRSPERVALIIEAADVLREADYPANVLYDQIAWTNASGTYFFTPDLVSRLHLIPIIIMVEEEIDGDIEQRHHKWQSYHDTIDNEFYIVTPGARTMRDISWEVRCWAQQNGLTIHVNVGNIDQIRKKRLYLDDVWIVEWSEP
ncbi:MAG: hypothetical protein GY832_34630 [Chloroflexi bacterium]|nr:hypothetical protein [Chloroflexota bacterium]